MNVVTQSSQKGLCVSGLNFSFDKKPILKAFDLELPAGEPCLILGPSGSGKTTLLSILSGLQHPDSGSVHYDGTSLFDLSERQRDQFRGQQIGMLFQTFHILKSFSVRQNLLLAYSMQDKVIDEPYIDNVLERLGLIDKRAQKAVSLSVGEAQRLALARALVGKPKWLLCDEPTSSLDDGNAQEVVALLQDESKQAGSSLVVVTHDQRVREHMQGHVVRLGETS